MFDINEKRRSSRVGLRIPLQYKEVDGSDARTQGTLTVDMSENGARFTTDKFIPLERHMLIETTLPSNSSLIKALSKVAWIRKMPYCDEYEVGIRFVSISKQDRENLSDSAKRFRV